MPVKTPSLDQWMDKVKENSLMEKMTVSLRLKRIFSKRWEKWTVFARAMEDAVH